MVRKIIGTVVGMLTAFVVITILQMAMILIATPPTQAIIADPVKLKEWVSAMPVAANLVLALGYLLGSFAGGFVATKIAGGAAGFLPSLIVGILLTAAGVVNFFFAMPGSPVWLIALCLVIYIPASLFGHRTAR